MLLLTKSKGHKSNSPYLGFPKHLQTKFDLHISIRQSQIHCIKSRWETLYDQILILISKRFCHHCESLVLLVRDKLKCLQSVIIDFTSHSNNTMDFPQGCLISEGILTLAKLQTKGAKSLS